jgi:hypothetical protein
MTIIVGGGSVATDGAYTVRTFVTSDTLTVSGGTLTDVQYLLVAGGGYDLADGATYYARLEAQPGVLIIRYPSP